jgi:hypothetical protein
MTLGATDDRRDDSATEQALVIEPENREISADARDRRPGSKAREDLLAKELADRERRISHLECACRQAVRDRELAVALVGRPIVPGGAVQLLKLLRDELEVREDAGGFRASTPDGRPLREWLGERLDSQEFSHFFATTTRGGAGAAGLSRSPGRLEAATSETLGEAIVSQWREAATRRGAVSASSAWGRRG